MRKGVSRSDSLAPSPSITIPVKLTPERGRCLLAFLAEGRIAWMMFILLAEIAGYRAPPKTAENPATRPVRAMLGVSWATGRLGTLKVVSNTDVKSRASPEPASIHTIE